MMKYTGGVSLALGLTLGVPALTLGDGLPDSVETALAQTMRSLEVLGELDGELTRGGNLPSGALHTVTEAPLADGRTRDELYAQLRDEVAGLQSQLDSRKLASDLSLGSNGVGGAQPFSLAALEESIPKMVQGDGTVESLLGHATPGLSPTFVKALGSGQYSPRITPGAGSAGLSASSTDAANAATSNAPSGGAIGTPISMGGADATASTSTNGAPAPNAPVSGYSANPLRQAQACYRAGRYEQGVKILATVESDVTVDYWRARLLEKSGRVAEAIDLFAKVEAAEDAGTLAVAAKREREFAEWRLDFERRAGVTSGAGTPSTDAADTTDAGAGQQ